MKLFRAFLLLAVCYFPVQLDAQGLDYTNHWYSGFLVGLDFNGAGPSVVTGGQITSIEGVSSASDSVTGGLLFYTDGQTVWNRNHTVMTNGTGLNGGSSAVQAALVVPDPANNGQYYIFHVHHTGSVGLQWTKVDMTLSSGFGSVTTKNQLLTTPTTEKLCAVKHANGNDVWVLTLQSNANTFRAFRVTNTGIVAGPVSTVGAVPASGIGQMKFSPNGQFVAWVDHGNGSAHLYDFNDATGVVSNHSVLASGQSKAAGVSFSPTTPRSMPPWAPTTRKFTSGTCAPAVVRQSSLP